MIAERELRTLRESGVWRVESGVADAEGESNISEANYHIAERLAKNEFESIKLLSFFYIPCKGGLIAARS